MHYNPHFITKMCLLFNPFLPSVGDQIRRHRARGKIVISIMCKNLGPNPITHVVYMTIKCLKLIKINQKPVSTLVA